MKDDELRRLGARGMVRPSTDTLQVVVGPVADQLAGDIRKAVHEGAATRQLDVSALTRALGGSSNIESIDVCATRLSIRLRQGSLDTAAIKAAGARGAVAVGQGLWHVIIGPHAQDVAQRLQPAPS